MLAQRSCASRFVRRLFFVSSMSSFYTRSRRGLPIVLGGVAVLLFAVVALGISGEILRRAIYLAVVAVVALDGERRPAIRPLSDVFRILAEHRVVTSGPSRRALRFGGARRGSFVNRTRSGVPSLLSVGATYEGSEAPLALAEGCFGHGGAGGGITHRRDDRERDGKIYRRESQVHARTRCVCWGGAIVEKSGALVDPSEIRLDTRRRHRCFELALSSGA